VTAQRAMFCNVDTSDADGISHAECRIDRQATNPNNNPKKKKGDSANFESRGLTRLRGYRAAVVSASLDLSGGYHSRGEGIVN
jgi:hypothetical protein